MARITDSSVREVRAAADMVEVVSARTQLRRASGSRFTGRCPFHEERTPSFSVNPVEKLYHCFGCGKGGDVISFVQESENLDFVGAVESLAERFRVTLEYEESSPRQDEARRRRERLYAVLEQTTGYFERLLWEGDGGASVRAYLAERGLGEEVAKEFRLGLAPGRGLAEKARERGFTADELRSAGLTTVRGGDYFPRRLMFPLADVRGRVVGFQARKLDEDDPLRGKYVNSPEGDLFHKGSILYGLHLARTAISKQDRAAIVEGNTDVIALRQAGFEPVVASMGTALTERQLRELGRLTRQDLPLLRRGRGRPGGDAARDGAGRGAGVRGEGRHAAARPGSGRRARGLRGAARRGGELSALPRAPRARALGRPPGGVRPGARGALEGRGLARAAGGAASRRRPARPPEGDARRDRARLRPKGLAVGPAPEAPRLLGAGDRLERDVLAACVAHPELLPGLEELTPEHFDSELHRRFRAQLVSKTEDPELTGLLAELDARAAQEAIDRRTGQELMLRLRERKLKRDLAGADLARTTELQARLAKVRQSLAELT